MKKCISLLFVVALMLSFAAPAMALDADLAFDPAVAGTKALTGCDLHPGALRYYMEMGYINEAGEAVAPAA